MKKIYFAELIRQKPLTVWSLRERLMLASSVLQSGDQNWLENWLVNLYFNENMFK